MKRVKGQYLTRQSFSKIRSNVEMPNLLDIQLESYEDFLQLNLAPDQREPKGLQAVFESVFPIEDSRGNFKMEFKDYFLGAPKYTVEECQDRGMSYSIPLKANLRLEIALLLNLCGEAYHFGELTTSLEFIELGIEKTEASKATHGIFYAELLIFNAELLYTLEDFQKAQALLQRALTKILQLQVSKQNIVGLQIFVKFSLIKVLLALDNINEAKKIAVRANTQ